VAAAAGDGGLAASLLGHAERVRVASRVRPGSRDLVDVDRATHRARALIGDDGYLDAFEAGRTSDIDVLLKRVVRTDHPS
jgi:hypothetical protein